MEQRFQSVSGTWLLRYVFGTYQLPVTYHIPGAEVTFEDRACTLKSSRCFLNLYPLPAYIVSSSSTSIFFSSASVLMDKDLI